MEQRRFAVLTDSACDLPPELEQQYGIDILNFKIALDGEAYTERVDFTSAEYCDLLRGAKGLPTTSQVTAYEFLEKFKAYDDESVEQVLYISINAGGSSTNSCAHQAAKEFAQKRPDSKMEITIVDSHCYSMAYGAAVCEAAQMLCDGKTMQEVVDYLDSYFSRIEIVLTAYSLKVIRKSGRISAAAAIAGELLGIHPIFTLNDGISEVVKKVRGEKAVCTNVARLVKARMLEGAPYYIGVSNRKYVDEYTQMLGKEIGYAPKGIFDLGCAVCSNTGAEAVGIVFEGETRQR